MAITNLARRLTKLEGRFDVGKEPIVHVIRFVDSDGTMGETLTLTHGGRIVQAGSGMTQIASDCVRW